jgi:hypothetical protein
VTFEFYPHFVNCFSTVRAIGEQLGPLENMKYETSKPSTRYRALVSSDDTDPSSQPETKVQKGFASST